MDAAFRKVYQYAEPNLTLIGWMGLIGFPAYFVIWEYIFPQPYENLPLRLFCSVLFLIILFRNKVKLAWQDNMHLYYQVAMTVCLPFFFFYMLFMNDWSSVWLLSCMAAIFVHILMVHITRVMFIQTFIGITLAIFFAWVSKDYHLALTMNWTYVPIFLFMYMFGNLFYFRNQMEHETKVSIAKVFGAGIAHEMRNPLSGLCTSIDLIQAILPNPHDQKKANYTLSAEDALLLREISHDAMNIIRAGNETIDLLLTSIDENRVSRSTFKKHSAQHVLENAMTSFGYKSATDRFLISIDIRDEFEFLGSDTLLKYVIYNLFKNAFHHRSPENFHINVTLESDERESRIIVRDNGSGIPEEIIEHIFDNFYTTGRSGSYGLGLPFCKKVMVAFGGNISCTSELGAWSEFTLHFPALNSDEVDVIERNVLHLKSMLIVSDQSILTSKAIDTGKALSMRVDSMSTLSMLQKKEHEFEYDLVFIDLESMVANGDILTHIEPLLSFTNARIIYLFQHCATDYQTNAVFNPVWIEARSWLLNTPSAIKGLLFDATEQDMMAPLQCVLEPQKHTILVVDDSETLRKFTAKLLEKLGFNVIQCKDGGEAIETLDNKRVDLVLMDIEMPVMSGVEASRIIRDSGKSYSSVPIIAHTGDSSRSTLDKVASSGMSDFIVKPSDRKRLHDKIVTWVS
ncbi:hybrid sensor histidine kinase/response regulator [Enterovibrio norvegicus]|uniref:hybrid sensor histidine kinase/response regulator n=1 Tax=Enterovibrio norvegicus TaxID=188144 RepID=UPI0002F9E09E|nr:hybrid sensor histidine kinase/response regulator [Enterovibrio norvegicus]OEE50022.1 hybrid sensor histidine kinase/response regulator [Enterovibrio norvegicus]